jgi:hypothetical protein
MRLLILLIAVAPTFCLRAVPLATRRGFSHRAASVVQGDVAVTADQAVIKRTQRAGNGMNLDEGSVAVVRYECRVAGETTPFAASPSFQYTLGSGEMIKGWDAALRSMRVGEQAQFACAAAYGYGAAGVAPVVPPNAALEFDIEVLTYRGNVLTASTFADNAPLMPRSAGDIKAQYELRQAAKAPEPQGFAGLVKRLKSTYVFGFFDSETGESAPWYLRPSLTFPMMIGVVGITFWVIIAGGGVMLKGDLSPVPGEGSSFELL